MPHYLAKYTTSGKCVLYRYNDKPTLKDKQDLLGGYLELLLADQNDNILIKSFEGVYYDEEGLHKGLPVSDYNLCSGWNALFFPVNDQ